MFLDMITDAARTVGKMRIWQIWTNEYRSQIQQKESPYGQCFAMCTAWFLQVFGLKKTSDQVMKEINSMDYQDWTRENIGSWAVSQYAGKLNMIWKTESQYIEDRLRAAGMKNQVVYTEQIMNEEMKDRVQAGIPVIVGTRPWYRGDRLGHLMLVVGYIEYKDSWIIDDPFGDFRVQYATGNIDQGNDLHCPVSDFDQIRTGLAITAYGPMPK